MISEVSAKEFTNVLEKPSPDGFSISREDISIHKREAALSGGFLLLLNFLVDFAGARVWIKLFKLNLALNLLLVLASTANVPGSRAQ